MINEEDIKNLIGQFSYNGKKIMNIIVTLFDVNGEVTLIQDHAERVIIKEEYEDGTFEELESEFN